MSELYPGAITDIEGIRVGHASDQRALTGCSVVLCEDGATAGISVRGWAPGTRETDLLRPGMLVEEVQAILLSGGSAYGLRAADGVMRWLEEQGHGFNTGVARVPIVPAAVLFDLAVGDPRVRPDEEMGYQACASATADAPAQGNVGAGTGASVGKLFGTKRAVKSGIGTASVRAGGLVLGALVAVNAFGDVLHPESGQIMAGLRTLTGKGYADTRLQMRSAVLRRVLFGTNTVIGVVATNATLSKAEATLVADATHDGLARTIRPAHTLFDGDAIFALATGEREAHIALVADMAADAMARAVVNAVLAAEDAGGLPCAHSMGIAL
jgi:L-aminopeptidase/D-esterase-like protein